MKYHKDMTEEEQLAAVRENGFFLRELVKVGITPSEAVQLLAVELCEWGYAMDIILQAKIIPSEAVQLKSVRQSIYSFEDLIIAGITPSQEVTNTHYVRWEL